MDSSEGALMGIMAGFGIFTLLIIALFIFIYVILSLALMKIAQKKGIENAWLAWIPIGNSYIIGKIAGPFHFITDIAKPELVLPIMSLCGFIPVVGWLIVLAGSILTYAAYYTIFKEYRGEKATTMIILTIIFGFIALPIYFHSIAKELDQQTY